MIKFNSPHKLAGLPENEPILLALSGGADSSALLDLLAAYAKEHGCTVFAAHVDHLIRADEHDRDRLFCETLAAKYGIKIFTKKADVPKIAAETGDSLETAARRVRYEFFAEIMKENGIKILATAHNADDNLETLIFNITRGTALRGACGIPPTREFEGGIIVRPILGAKKSEIISYCDENGLSYVTDSTNSDASYARNRIRLNVLPELRHINAEASAAAKSLTESLALDYDFIRSEAEKLICDGGIPLDALNEAHPSLRRHAILLAFEKISNTGLESVHIEAILSLCKRSKNFSRVSLPGAMSARIENGYLRFMADKKGATQNENYEITLKMGKNVLPRHIILYVTEQNDKNIYKSATQAKISCDKIMGKLVARPRMPGDKILMNGIHRDLRKLMNEKKLPPERRSEIPVVSDDNGVLFVPYIGIRDGAFAGSHNICIELTEEINEK